LLLAVLLHGIAATGFAQILNPGFDAWSGGNPVSWNTNNRAPALVPVTQTADAHSNGTAARGEVKTFSKLTVGPNLVSGQDARGFAVNAQQPTLHGWYKFFPAGDDLFYVTVSMTAGGTAVGAGAFTTPDSASEFTEFVMDITYFQPTLPDTCIISITINNFTGNVNAGSAFIVDDIAFGPVTAVEGGEDRRPERFELSQNYPNPFNPSTVIRYSVPRVGPTFLSANSVAPTRVGPTFLSVNSVGPTLLSVYPVSLRVYDLLGRLVATLVDGQQAPGAYSARWDASNVPSGMYVYRLQAGSFSDVKKMIVVR
jgi:hypothetical protein